MKDKHKQSALRRLKIISGQINGLSKQIEDDKYCVDVLTQIAAVQEGLRGVSREVFQNHLETCVKSGFERGEGDAYVKEISEVIFKLNR